MKQIFHLACFLGFAIGIVPASSFCRSDETNYYSHQLHSIALESTSINDQIPKGQYAVINLKSSDMPLRVSKLYFSPSALETVPIDEFGLSGDAFLLDICTFQLSNQEIVKGRQVKRENALSNLRYSLKVRSWTKDYCEVEFAGNHGKKLARTVAQLSRTTTTLIRVDRLCLAFTFLDAALKNDELMRLIKNPNGAIIPPQPIRQPLPAYPPELIRVKSEGEFYFLGIVNDQGTVERSHGIILECLHGLFARNALDAILNNWRFIPAQLDTKPISAICKMGVAFRLMPP